MLARALPMLRHVLDFAYPGVCANCDGDAPAGAVLCEECDAHLEDQARAHGCEKCAMPVATASAPCPYCLGKGVAWFDRIIRLGIFEDPLKHLIHQMKYHRRWPLGELLADRLLDTERAKALLTETDVLVPVPLHFRRHFSRGYNQADLIARRLGWQCRIPVLPAVRRTRATDSQTHQHSHAKRAANVRGAFALRPRFARSLEGKHVVVVDDVTTSASTLTAVGRVLSRAKPASLCAIVLAIADPRHRGFEAK
jgi:ComF family protein